MTPKAEKTRRFVILSGRSKRSLLRCWGAVRRPCPSAGCRNSYTAQGTSDTISGWRLLAFGKRHIAAINDRQDAAKAVLERDRSPRNEAGSEEMGPA